MSVSDLSVCPYVFHPISDRISLTNMCLQLTKRPKFVKNGFICHHNAINTLTIMNLTHENKVKNHTSYNLNPIPASLFIISYNGVYRVLIHALLYTINSTGLRVNVTDRSSKLCRQEHTDVVLYSAVWHAADNSLLLSSWRPSKICQHLITIHEALWLWSSHCWLHFCGCN